MPRAAVAQHLQAADHPGLSQAVDQAIALWRGDVSNRDFLSGASVIEGAAAAETAAARIKLEDEPPETGYVQPGLVEVQHAEALRRLGDLSAARDYAEEALRSADECHLRGQTHRLATLALVLAQRGEIDEAAAIGEKMLDRAEGMESGRIAERVGTVAEALKPYGGGAVREFLSRADQQGGIPL
jgi:tetratricopeptide (TPR) repeat protein